MRHSRLRWKEQAAPILLDGLERLEYRGYDSAGLAVLGGRRGLQVKKSKGRLSVLKALTDNGRSLTGTLGIGHTRWATHGEPNDINSHPHLSEGRNIAVVHNGIIENYVEIKEFLISQGMHFSPRPIPRSSRSCSSISTTAAGTSWPLSTACSTASRAHTPWVSCARTRRQLRRRTQGCASAPRLR